MTENLKSDHYSEVFDQKWVASPNITKEAIDQAVEDLLLRCCVNEDTFFRLVVKAITLIDLTTLSGDDTNSNIERLCFKALRPLNNDLCLKYNVNNITTAAVCVYPSKIAHAHKILRKYEIGKDVGIAAVATAFPSGLYPLKTRLHEIKYCLEEGATEVDVVIDRSLVLSGSWLTLYEELLEMRQACGNAIMKVILGVGELGTYNNIYKASMLAMHAGADFIKTSTGKEKVNATLPIGLIMCRAISKYYDETGRKVGLKPAGGIKTPQDAVNWLVLIHEELGDEWMNSHLFRIGASSLLGNLNHYINDKLSGTITDPNKYGFM